MKIDFNELRTATIPHLNGGEGAVTAAMFADGQGKIMKSVLPAGTSIGLHSHPTSYELNYVISGTGKAICHNEEESLVEGVCHYCPKGSAHSIINTGAEDLVLLTVVPEFGK